MCENRKLLFRVIVMPHSHNDPGWLKTVEGYFATATKNILNNIVNKLTLHTNMTFIWSEVGTTNTDTGGD
jgi:alpha-mannosidase